MKLIIAGGRNFGPRPSAFNWLTNLPIEVTEVVSGTCRGADVVGETWAHSFGIPIRKMPANWNAYGRRAGPMRNSFMVNYADAIALFPGGQGTADITRKAIAANLLVFTWEPPITNVHTQKI